MSEYCVVVADASRARFFTLEEAEIPEVESGPRLVERSDLVSPDAVLQGRERWSDTRSGANVAPGGGPSHRYDDHRDRHQDEVARRFARRITDAAAEMAGREGVRYLVVAAATRMLGFMRETLSAPTGANGVEIREIPKDLTPQSPDSIHRNLSAAGLLPARERPPQP